MPPVTRIAWTSKIRLDGSVIAAAFNAVTQRHNAGAGLLWIFGGRARAGPHPITRRSLFELHAGRPAASLPPNLDLDEVTRPILEDEVWFSNSDGLIEALGQDGKMYARPKPFGSKVDLSYADPILAAVNRRKALEEAQKAKERQEVMKKEGKHDINRKDILINYLQHIHPIVEHRTRSMKGRIGIEEAAKSEQHLNEALRKVFDESASNFLDSKGLDISNIMEWAWILTAQSSERAARRMALIYSRSFETKGGARTVPQFVFMFLLRRPTTTARALEHLLVYAWKLMEMSESKRGTAKFWVWRPDEEQPWIVKYDARGMSEHIFLIIIIRLLRIAREVWPATCESIIALLNRYVDGFNFRKRVISPSATLEPQEIAQLTYVYNTMLRLLSLPSRIHPFQSAIFQQRAQFSVLRRMNHFDPPLIVDRRGYRAVATIQLMHKKTLQEREWAHMKARSWPPWKEDKLGMDARVTVQDGVSRAKEVLNRAKEAGYARDDSAAAAEILSGWDTDGSPTIQFRTNAPLRGRNQIRAGHRQHGDSALVWAARIRATRTLDEAWSCFLACRDEGGHLSQPPYHEMFVKLIFDKQRVSGRVGGTFPTTNLNEQPVPGDGLEVQPAPVSPREAMYVRKPPPDLDKFLEIMEEDGIVPSGRFVTFLTAKSWSFEAGVRVLRASGLSDAVLSALLITNPKESEWVRDSISMGLFADFIGFLARYAPTMQDKHCENRYMMVKTGLECDESGRMESYLGRGWIDHDAEQHPRDVPRSRATLFDPLQRAYKLVQVWKPLSRQPYYHILRALASPGVVLGVYSSRAGQDSQDVKTWPRMSSCLDQMLELDLGPDLDGFRILCRGLEKVVLASERLSDRISRGADRDIDADTKISVNQVLSQGLPQMKELFKDIVRSPGMQEEIPVSIATEKSEIDRKVEVPKIEPGSTSEDDVDDPEDQKANASEAFLPPACLLPKLLEVPNPAQLHAFIRVLGLRRDYDGILDLIEWMSLFADEIDAVVSESMNGKKMMRRCLSATRVFLERSWTTMQSRTEEDVERYRSHYIIADPAPEEIIDAVRRMISDTNRWGGWATEEEVVDYCSKGKFI